MITLASLKQELDFNKSLGNIIEILKMTALAQFHTFQFRDKPNAGYLRELENAFGLLGNKARGHPYLLERKSLPSAIIIVTSDEGFLGGLNTFLVNAGLDARKSPNDEIVIIGERGVRYLEDAGSPFSSLTGISDDVKFAETARLTSYLLTSYKKKFGRAIVVYPKFISLTHQKVETFQLLPYIAAPARVTPSWEEITFEPYPHRIVEIIVELWTRFKLYEIFWSSKQSEIAARIMHLEGSTQELAAVNQKLAFDYFRRVHALSDKTIREVCAAKVLLEKYH